MKCKEIVRLLTYGHDSEPVARYEIAQHASNCKKCQEELAINSAIRAIVKNHSIEDDHSAWTVWDEVRLVNQVKARIQAGKDSELGTWESAVISMRGWLIGFAAAAILLLALSGQLAISNFANKKDEGKFDLISTAPTPSVNEDLISSNTLANRQGELTSEDVENGR